MPSENNQIEIIEQYLKGELSKAERADLEAKIAEDAALSTEVEAYRQLMEGFGAIQMSDFSKDMQEWEKEWRALDQEEIEVIEWYISGKLSGNALEQFEERVAKDINFAEKVNQYKSVLDGLGAMQMNEFAQLMEGWNLDTNQTSQEAIVKTMPRKEEAKVVGLRPIFRRLAVAAAILVLLFAGANWYANANYSNEQIIANLYEGPRSQTVMGDNENTLRAIDEQYKAAHTLFQNEQYTEAIQAFDQLLVALPQSGLDQFTANYYKENAEWNRILAQLGDGADNAQVVQDLELIANADKHDYKDKAQDLLSKMNSFWKNWAK